jgi:hypothetical protein
MDHVVTAKASRAKGNVYIFILDLGVGFDGPEDTAI